MNRTNTTVRITAENGSVSNKYKGTVTIYTVLCPNLGSNFLACVHCASTFRYRYLENNSFYNIKYYLICSWLYNIAAVSPKEKWVFLRKVWELYKDTQ